MANKICIACGWKPLEPEAPGKHVPPLPEREKCPNCGKEGTLREEPEEEDAE